MMETIKIIIQNEVRCKLVPCPAFVYRLINDKTRIFDYRSKFTFAYQNKIWDGYTSFINVGGDTYVQLLPEIAKIFQENKIPFEVVDNRINKDFNPTFEPIDENYLADVKWPKGHRLEGQSVVLAEHQVRAVNALLSIKKGTLMAATGAGKCLGFTRKLQIDIKNQEFLDFINEKNKKNYFYELTSEDKVLVYINKTEFVLKEPYCQICGKPLIINKRKNKFYARPCYYCCSRTSEITINKFICRLGKEKGTEEYIKYCETKSYKFAHEYNGHIQGANKLKELKKDPTYYEELKKKQTTNINYWINKGYSEEEAKQLLKERQSTFSLKKCIKKYGKEEGTKRFNERQEKWQATLNAKSNEEKELIQRKKIQKN